MQALEFGSTEWRILNWYLYLSWKCWSKRHFRNEVSFKDKHPLGCCICLLLLGHFQLGLWISLASSHKKHIILPRNWVLKIPEFTQLYSISRLKSSQALVMFLLNNFFGKFLLRWMTSKNLERSIVVHPSCSGRMLSMDFKQKKNSPHMSFDYLKY